ncbi:MAG TPA: hypothetical protein VFD70_29470 [Anaerolineae bacterium]|nr:hypothetical protein [Anaerolineae bacterium]
MNEPGESSSDPRYHTARIKTMLNDMTQHLREDATRVNDPRAQALFETSAEVLQGLVKAYEHFETQAEPAWK